jgi:hypothetical protein
MEETFLLSIWYETQLFHKLLQNPNRLDHIERRLGYPFRLAQPVKIRVFVFWL